MTSGSVQPGRVRVLKEGFKPSDGNVGPVVYWMFRDQRLRDNWALIHAVDQANRANASVAVAFNLFDQFLGAKARHLGFMLRGLKQLNLSLQETLQIPFFLFQVSIKILTFEYPFRFSLLGSCRIYDFVYVYICIYIYIYYMYTHVYIYLSDQMKHYGFKCREKLKTLYRFF